MPFQWILFNLYLEVDLAGDIADRAGCERVSTAELMRQFIDKGLQRPFQFADNARNVTASTEAENLSQKVPRSVYLKEDMLEALGQRSELEGVERCKLVLRYLREGLSQPAPQYKAYVSDP